MARLKPRVVFYNLWPEFRALARRQLPGCTTRFVAAPLDLNNADRRAQVVGVFIDSRITAKILARLPRLAALATLSTGFDHIDLPACQKRRVVVMNVPSYGENTVAEHTFALILGLTRKLFESVKRVKEGRYDFVGLRGVDLKDKTLGIIGTGRIGSHVAQIARGFGLRVIAYDPHPNRALSRELNFTYVSLPALLKQSDIITLHSPLTPQTHHLLNAKNLKLLKRGAYLINTARGALVDPAALYAALQSGALAGAGLDVLEDENLIQHFESVMQCSDCQLKTTLLNNLIIDHPHTIVTPHNAFNSTEALARIVHTTVENIRKFLPGRPQNVVGK